MKGLKKNRKKLKDKTCLLTGAAAGIGRALAVELAKEGVNLFLADINMEKLKGLKEELEKFGVKIFIGYCDVSKYEDLEKLAEEVYSKFDELDILINNAGIAGGGFIETLSLEEWKRVIDVNLWSIILAVKVFLPRMLERGEGYIVNTGSGAGIVGLPFHIQYVASKFAVVGLSEALYSELNQRGIDVSVICPTHVKTDIIERSNIAVPPNLTFGEAEEEINEKIEEFKKIFWERYNRDSITAEKAAKNISRALKNENFTYLISGLCVLLCSLKRFPKDYISVYCEVKGRSILK